MNYRKGWTIVPALVLVAGCHTDTNATADNRIHLQQEQQIRQEQARIEQTDLKNCSEAAQRILDRAKADNPTGTVSGSNHYNRGKSRCFMRLTTFGAQGKTWFETDDLLDAYENKVLFGCGSTNTTPRFCFIPGNSSPTGKRIDLTLADANGRFEDDMNN